MNRNNERHFNQVPETHVSRTRFKRDQNILTTFDAGKLIPFYVDEVLPGDTFSVDTAAIIRMTTPKYPVFDDAYIDFYYFFCPNRIVWTDFKRFMGEADDAPWMPTKTYTVPKIKISSKTEATASRYNGPKEGSILDYMGIPIHLNEGTNASSKTIEINALPIRAYVKIWNEFFRDQNVGNPAVELSGNDNQVWYDDDGDNATMERILACACTGGRCLPVSRFHDYFSSCLPYPQRGPEVNLPLTGNAMVGPMEYTLDSQGKAKIGTKSVPIGALIENGAIGGSNVQLKTPTFTVGNDAIPLLVAGQGGVSTETAVLGANLATVTAATINQLRQAFAVQHYYEALARGGSRYREQVRAIFGVSISDKTVQVPEYLGGGRYHVNINQIVQTSGQQTANDTPIGETGAMSVTPINESSFTKSFEEHGFVIGVMCVRHNHSYQQGLEKFWSRTDRLDYYFPQFANLGEQPVKKKEIYLTGTDTDEETFGYQEAWADYRMKPDRISGKMRSNAQGTLDFWHYADNYSKVPTLSQEWMNEGKEEIARTLIVQDEPQFFGAIRVMNKTTRCMPLYSVPGLEKL